MKIKESYPVFVTAQLTETISYYTKWFEFEVFFESTWFVLLQSKSEKPYFIAFMDQEHPTSPPSIPAINASAGVFLTLEVDDVEAEFQKLKAAGIEVYYDLRTEAWGQKRFGLIDPNGMYIDVVEQVEPKQGYWDQYLPNVH